MIDGLEPVALQELRALDAPRTWSVEGRLDALQSLTPVRGHLSAEHQGNVLAVKGALNTIVTLTCDRCLGQFNQQLSCHPQELIRLGASPPSEEQVQESADIAAMDGLVECLDPRGVFDPEQWVFEQLNLLLPVVNHCGDHCQGPALDHHNPDRVSEESSLDPRWQALLQLKGE